jgi:hypothetical protein
VPEVWEVEPKKTGSNASAEHNKDQRGQASECLECPKRCVVTEVQFRLAMPSGEMMLFLAEGALARGDN